MSDNRIPIQQRIPLLPAAQQKELSPSQMCDRLEKAVFFFDGLSNGINDRFIKGDSALDSLDSLDSPHWTGAEKAVANWVDNYISDYINKNGLPIDGISKENLNILGKGNQDARYRAETVSMFVWNLFHAYEQNYGNTVDRQGTYWGKPPAELMREEFKDSAYSRVEIDDLKFLKQIAIRVFNLS